MYVFPPQPHLVTDRTTPGEPDLRTLLIRAALDILDEPETPLDLRKVAERAGKSRTAPYLVFGKEREGGGVVALRLAVAAEGARMLVEELEAVEDPQGDPLEAFHVLATAFFQFATTHGRLFRLMFGPEIGVAATLRGLAPRSHPELERLVHERMVLEAKVQGIVRRCQEARLLPEGDSIRPTMIAWANLQGIALLLLDEVLELADVWTTTAEAADLATEALVGTPRSVLEGARLCLLQAQELRAEKLKARAAEHGEPEVAWTLDELAAPTRREVPKEPAPTAFWTIGRLDRPSPRNLRVGGAPEEERATPMGRESPAGPEPAIGPPADITSHPALRRALAARTALRGARILWIDDHPEWIEWERRMLERLEVDVTTAANTGRALELLREESYDLILSDIARGSHGGEGVAALPELRSVAPDTPVIFYVGALDEGRGAPPGSAGITNRPGELLHLALDVLERRRS